MRRSRPVPAGSASPATRRFAPGRDLEHVIEPRAPSGRSCWRSTRSRRSARPAGPRCPAGSPRSACAPTRSSGSPRSRGVAVLLTGHVTKDGDLAGPRALEHAVDVVLTFDGDPRSGLRVLTGGKNRFGAEGETAWFEMGPGGLREIDPDAPAGLGECMPGAAGARPVAVAAPSPSRSRPSSAPPTVRPGARRPGSTLDGSSSWRPCSTGPSACRSGAPSSSGRSSGGVKVDDPACDLAVAAALASAATGASPPAMTAFVGEVSLTGLVRPAPAMSQRLRPLGPPECTHDLRAGGRASHPRASA